MNPTWTIWEQFRTRSGRVYMTRYSHGKCYAWEIWDAGSIEYRRSIHSPHWTEAVA